MRAGSRRGGMGWDVVASWSSLQSGSAGGASSSGDQVAASNSGGTLSVNVFQGSERPSARTSTKACLFKKIDGWVFQGRDCKESTDTKEKWERFANCTVGTHDSGSGYLRMFGLRQRKGVKKKYDTLQSSSTSSRDVCCVIYPSLCSLTEVRQTASMEGSECASPKRQWNMTHAEMYLYTKGYPTPWDLHSVFFFPSQVFLVRLCLKDLRMSVDRGCM